MDDGELDFFNQGGIDFSIDNIFGDFFKETETVCTHNHICNPPSGPDSPHRHTCIHVHTKILSSNASEDDEDKNGTDDTAESVGGKKHSKKSRRPLGNREAVRKYREKKKARAASLEDEVTRLQGVNQQLVRRLQGQAALEAEVVRLKCLLVDVRGRIEGEIGSFPYQKPVVNPNYASGYAMNRCNVQCDDQMYCPQQRGSEGRHGDGVAMNGQGFNGCEFENVECFTNQDGGSIGISSGCDIGNVMMESNVGLSGTKKRKGARGAAAN